MPLEQNPELNELLSMLIDAITSYIPPGARYTDKQTGVRVKWVDRGTQKAIKILDGKVRLVRYEDLPHLKLPPKTAKQESGVPLSGEDS